MSSWAGEVTEEADSVDQTGDVTEEDDSVGQTADDDLSPAN